MTDAGMRGNVQKAAVRVIASELDRRSGSLERALTDLAARVEAMSVEARDHRASLDARTAAIAAQAEEVARAQDKLATGMQELTARVRARESVDDELGMIVADLRADLGAAQTAIAMLTSLADRQASPR